MRMPVYRLETWRAAPLGTSGLYFQPTLRSLVARLFAAVVFGMLAAGCLYFAETLTTAPEAGPISPAMEESLRDAEARTAEMARQLIQDGVLTAEALEEKRAARQRAAAAERARWDTLNRGIRTAFLALAGLFAAIAVLAPLALIWERVWIAPDAMQQMVVTTRGTFGMRRRRAYPRGTFEYAVVRAREHMLRTRQMGLIQQGWMWEVLLLGREGVVFCVDHSARRPMSNGRMPDQVRLCAEHFARMAGCALRAGYSIAEAEVRRGLFSSEVRYHEAMPREVRHYEGRLEDLPPELRDRMIEAMQQRGPVLHQATRSTSLQRLPDGRYRLEMPDGSSRICASLEELPPDLRELIRRHGMH
jgi:hypothetical protein